MGRDGKYGLITTEHGYIPEDEPVIVFRARDQHLPELLTAYWEMCQRGGSPQRHLALIDAATETVLDWQDANPDLVRVPDSESSRGWLGG